MNFVVMKQQENVIQTIKDLLNAAIHEGDAARRTCFMWLTGARRDAPANDPVFRRQNAISPPLSDRKRAKKSAKQAEKLTLLRSFCNFLFWAGFGENARRY